MTDKQALIEELNKIIALANHEIEQKDWQKASLYAKNGLDTLGERYFNPKVLDESSLKLVIADDFERKGLLEKSARLRLRTLEGRLDSFKANP